MTPNEKCATYSCTPISTQITQYFHVFSYKIAENPHTHTYQSNTDDG